MKLKRLILFFLASSLDVQVKAEGLNLSVCRVSQSECIYRTQDQIEILKTSGGQIHVSAFSVYRVGREASVEFVRGVFRIDSKNEVTVRTRLGDIQINKGIALVESKDEIINVFSVQGITKYRPRGDKQSYILPEGYSTYFGSITNAGVASTGFPATIDVLRVTRLLGQVTRKQDRDLFRSELKDFLVGWNNAKEGVSEWYLDTIQREIAAIRDHEAETARRRSLELKENERYREMLRKRIFLEF